jgi:hypothetical protein
MGETEPEEPVPEYPPHIQQFLIKPTPVEEFVAWLDQELIKLVKEKG